MKPGGNRRAREARTKTRIGETNWQVSQLISLSCFRPNFSISSFFAENPSHCSWTFKHQPITMFLNVDLLLLHQPITKSLNADTLLFPNASVVDACGAELRSCCILRHLIFLFFNGHCVGFFQKSPLSSVSGSVDPCFVGLVAAFKWICGVFKFLFEEFVNVIFPSFSWSPDRSVGVVSCAQFRVSVSSLSFFAICGWVTWRYSVPVSISFLCVLFQHRIFALFTFLWLNASLYVFNAVFFFSINVASISSFASSADETSLSTSL